MTIQHVSSLNDFNAAAEKAGGLVVIDFHAKWCGPCHAIAPFYESLASNPKYRGVSFLKCDVDEARDVASKFSVSAMPTFVFYRNGSTLKTVRGADKNGLQKTLDECCGGTSASGGSHSWGSGQALGTGQAQAAPITAQAQQAFQGLDPNLKIALALAVVYLWWILS